MKVGKYEVDKLDQYNIAIFEPKVSKKTGETYRGNALYFSTWESAFNRLLDLKIEAQDKKDLKQVITAIENSKQEIIKAIKLTKF